jgi:hypothetical protein
VNVLSAPVSVYSLQNKQSWLLLFSDLFFLCTAGVHVCLCIRPAVRYLRFLAAWGMKVRPLSFACVHSMPVFWAICMPARKKGGFNEGQSSNDGV